MDCAPKLLSAQTQHSFSDSDKNLIEVLQSVAMNEVKTKKEVLLPLLDEINERQDESLIFHIVDSLDHSDLLGIYKELYHESIKRISSIDMSIILICIKVLLKKFDGYNTVGIKKNRHMVLNNLRLFLKQNINHVLKTKDKTIQDCNQTEVPSAQIECPYKKLKTVFYHEYDNETTILNYSNPRGSQYNRTNSFIQNFSAREVMNWPHIEIHLILENFEMVHRNNHISNLRLVKFSPQYKPKIDTSKTKIRHQPQIGNEGNIQEISTAMLVEYLHQVKQGIRSNPSIAVGRKIDILSIITELINDIEYCKTSIETCTEYHVPLNQFRYIRYLGQSSSGPSDNPQVEYKNQITIENVEKCNVRLQEIIQPMVMFTVNKFNATFEQDSKQQYKFKIDTLLEATNWLLYVCSLCDVKFKGISATQDLGFHLCQEHGKEPDWFCVKCDTSFTMKKLTLERWDHKCVKSDIKRKSNVSNPIKTKV